MWAENEKEDHRSVIDKPFLWKRLNKNSFKDVLALRPSTYIDPFPFEHIM